jgi:hypothetical protein
MPRGMRLILIMNHSKSEKGGFHSDLFKGDERSPFGLKFNLEGGHHFYI